MDVFAAAEDAHTGNRTQVTSTGGLYDTTTLGVMENPAGAKFHQF